MELIFEYSIWSTTSGVATSQIVHNKLDNN